MKVTLEQLYKANGAIKRLMLEPVPVKIANQFKDLFLDELNQWYEQIENKHLSLIKEYGTIDENQNLEFDGDSQKKFLKDFSEYLKECIHVEWEPVHMNDLGKNTKISVRDLEDISFLIDCDE